MKIFTDKIYPILFLVFVLFHTVAFSQISIKDVYQNNIVTSKWKDTLVQYQNWQLIAGEEFNGKKFTQTINTKVVSNFKFLNSTCVINPGRTVTYMQKTDTFKMFSADYFIEQKTLFLKIQYFAGVPGLMKENYKIVYLQDDNLVLELIDDYHFDNESGKILTEEESKKRIEDNLKKNNSGLFGGWQINIGSKKKLNPRYFFLFKGIK